MKRVSVRQSLDGRSFSLSGAEQRLTPGEAVEVEVLTWQTLLVPVEAFDPVHAAGLLSAAGMPCTVAQEPVWTPQQGGQRGLGAPEEHEGLQKGAGTAGAEAEGVSGAEETEEALAVIALNKECRQELEARFAAQSIVYTAPLLRIPQNAERCVWLCQAGEVLYIKVYDPTLRLAEAIPVKTEADPLYLIGRVGRMFPLREFELRIAGHHAHTLRKALGRHFRSVTCES